MIVGIDPGLSGALAFLSAGSVVCYDMPVLRLLRNGKNKGEVDGHSLAALLHAERPDHAFVEMVNAMPGQGVSSMFAFGKAYGVVIGVLAAQGVPMTFVSPARWKRALGVPAAKDGAKARASQLLPSAAGQWPLAKHAGRAEAALLALYGSQQ